MNLIKYTLFISVLMWLGSSLALAQDNLSSVAKHKLDLLFKKEQIIPNIKDVFGMDGDTITLPAHTEFSQYSGVFVQSERQGYFIALGDNNDFVAVLAVFPEGSDKPLTVLNVKQDRLTWINDKTVQLGKNQAFVLDNHHFNSSQGYLISSLFLIEQGKLQLIDAIFTLSARGLCESFTETLSWKTTKHSNLSHPPFTAIVTLDTQSEDSSDESCVKKSFPQRVFTKNYVWNKRKHVYEGSDKQFKQLQHFNEQNL
jgi:hypothetical protein